MTTKLSDFDQKFIIQRYTAIEAGHVNHPNDLGKETNHGITHALANTDHVKKALVEKFGWDGTMKNLSVQMAYWIYQTEFWDRLRATELYGIHPLLADKMFDIAINAGRKRAVTFLQEYLNAMNNEQKLYPDLKVDGGIGDITFRRLADFIKARGKAGTSRVIGYLLSKQESYYIDISLGREANEAFTWGWSNRVHDCRCEYQRVAGFWS